VAAVRTRFGLDPSSRLLLNFGYVRPYKGVEDAIAAMSELPDDTVLVVAGECWGDEGVYRGAVTERGLESRVRLEFRYHANEELPALFAAADAVVLPYRSASQSGVAAMAFAFGRPVVATATGGLGEVVIEGVTGALAEPNDPSSLARAITRVLSADGGFGAGLGEARERMSWANYADIVVDFSSRLHPPRDPSSHAVLDASSRHEKARKIIGIVAGERSWTGARVLDVGVGSGAMTAEFARAVGLAGRVDGVDVDDVRLDRDGYVFTRYDGSRLPFEDARFDIVVSNHVLEHVGDATAQLRHLAELRRVVAPDGVVYVALPNRLQLVENHYRLVGLSWLSPHLADRYMRLAGRGDRYDCRPLSPRRLRQMMRATGLETRDATRDLLRATLDRRVPAFLLRLAPSSAMPTVAAIGRRG
jgi:SAM-dependent methyltransferase